MNTIWIEDDENKELKYAWSQLEDPVMENDGECWQYMGSSDNGDGWKHTFRHRSHPATNDRVIVNVPASIGWPKLIK